MRALVLSLILIPGLLAQDPPKKACNSERLGRFWPDQANTDPALARRAARCGVLKVCTSGTYTQRWKDVTVHASQLGKSAKPPIPGCEEFQELNPPVASDTARLAGKPR